MQEFTRQAPLSKPRGKQRQGPTCGSEKVLEDMRSDGKKTGAELAKMGPGRPT
jgi:hypothetical protein